MLTHCVAVLAFVCVRRAALIGYWQRCEGAVKDHTRPPRLPKWRHNPSAAVSLVLHKSLFNRKKGSVADPASIGLQVFAPLADAGAAGPTRRRRVCLEAFVNSLPCDASIRWARGSGKFYIDLARPACLKLMPPAIPPPLLPRCVLCGTVGCSGQGLTVGFATLCSHTHTQRSDDLCQTCEALLPASEKVTATISGQKVTLAVCRRKAHTRTHTCMLAHYSMLLTSLCTCLFRL